MKRREFLLGGAAAWSLEGQVARPVTVSSAGTGFRRQLAARELLRGLAQLRLPARLGEGGEADFALRVEPGGFRGTEEYSIAARGRQTILTGASEQALLHAVFDFLERQGAFFGIDGESYPIARPERLARPPAERPWTAAPRFAVRGLLPWPDFLNCISVFNGEDFRAYFEGMLRMRFNTFGMHVYTEPKAGAESYLSFEFGGVGHRSFLENTAMNHWGYLPERTSRFGMGGAEFFASEVFGSDAARLAGDPWEAAGRTRSMLRGAFAYARDLGIRTGIGFEPYQVPDEILKALPPEVRSKTDKGPRFDIESVTARDLLETRLGALLEDYPEVDHVWLWEDERMNWDSRRTGETLSATPFLQAHDFLRRHAPRKRLILAGWGGVARHFASFHQRLPGDVIFSCLSDSLGWDPIHEVFGKLEGRERWPIPWLEDDPSMWLPQLHVHRFQSDLDRAAELGCQGLLGIHWRHRMVDPTAGYQARFSWDAGLAPAPYYAAYASTQAAPARAARLAEILDAADRDRKLLDTFSGGAAKDGHAETREFSGDYDEAFMFWKEYEPAAAMASSQREVAAALGALAGAAATPQERERLAYLAGYVQFLVPYTEAWTLAHRLHGVLQAALKLKQGSQAEQARQKVREEGVPLWLRLAPEVRRAMLDFQGLVATRNDLGTLASLHNKFVRLALVRLRLSMKEFLGTLPPETEDLLARVRQTEAQARLFVPTRPSLLRAGEKVRIQIVSTAAAPALHTRVHGGEWSVAPVRLLGRRTWEATLGPFLPGAALAEYYVSAGKLAAPAEGVYLLTLATRRENTRGTGG